MHDDYVIPEAGPERTALVLNVGTEMVHRAVRAALVDGAEDLKADRMTVDEFAVLAIDQLMWANKALKAIVDNAESVGEQSADYARKLKEAGNVPG